MSDLTQESILAMEAGPEFDALVAPIMGLTSRTSSGKYGTSILWYRANGGVIGRCPRYSTNIAAAWEVVLELTRVGIPVEVTNPTADNDHGWACNAGGSIDDAGSLHGPNVLMCKTAPRAICLAALLTTLPAKDSQP